MNLYIAEKPSLGRAIAGALPKPHKNHKTHIEVGNGDIVTWCIGHILEQAEPDAYDEKYKKWQLADLPIIPNEWILKPKYQTRSQLAVIRKLVKQAKQLIHAGDPDREGQLLVDEVISYLKTPKQKIDNAKRLLISDLNLPAVKRSLAQLKSNKEFMPLSISALARSRADWLYGINMTRAYTIQGGKAGYQGVLSVGRVQTPILGLVVRRDLEIENFNSKPFYDVLALVETQSNQQFKVKWQPSEACKPYMDEDGRVLVKSLAENVIRRIVGQPAVVSDLVTTPKKQNPPLPYNLSSLQIDSAKRYGMNAKVVLDICQSLYERHKLITYPRSDSRYLPKEQLGQAKDIIPMLANTNLEFAQHAKNANVSLKSKAWNDSKVSAHHAIIPTLKSPNSTSLSSAELNVYQLIVRQYIAQFYPAFLYDQTKVTVTINNGIFTASSKHITQVGFKELFQFKSKGGNQNSNNNSHNESANLDDETSSQTLPKLHKGEELTCINGELLEKVTQPPTAFTDATLLAAMTGIARFVTNAEIKKILKETDGLGTEATRAGIIELLFKRGFLERTGKKISATSTGRALIGALPEASTLPDMTAEWEATLNAICDQQANYQSFMQPLTQTVNQFIDFASANIPTGLQGLKAPGKPAFKKRRKAAGTKYKKQ